MGRSSKRQLQEVDVNSIVTKKPRRTANKSPAAQGQADKSGQAVQSSKGRRGKQAAAEASKNAPKAKPNTQAAAKLEEQAPKAKSPALTKEERQQLKADTQERLMAELPKVGSSKGDEWRQLGFTVNLQEDPSAKAAVETKKRQYWNVFQEAMIIETKRVDAIFAAWGEVGGKPKGAKDPSKRPDRVAGTLLNAHTQDAGGSGDAAAGAEQAAAEGSVKRKANNGKAKEKPSKLFGFVPGIMLNDKFYNRVEMAVVGLHAPPLAGIDYMTKDEVTKMTNQAFTMPVAMSVVVAGNYEDDHDTGDELIYTGQGGNNLLGDKKQVAHQQLLAGNLALTGNVVSGVPVRVTRKNEDAQSVYGVVYTFDGLYRVTEWWMEAGTAGFDVFKFRLRRLPKQAPLQSKSVAFGGVKSVPLQITPKTRPHILHLDLSLGQEPIPIVVVNEVDRELPPGIDPKDPKQAKYLVRSNKTDTFVKSKVGYQFRYITRCEYDARVPRPEVTQLVQRKAGQSDEEYRRCLHARLAKLNGGDAAYHLAGGVDGVAVAEADEEQGDKKKKSGPAARLVRMCKMPLAVAFQCGSWCGCPNHDRCIQAPDAVGLRLRLEVFKTTDNRGWGVRCWDTIPAGATVCTFVGRIYSVGDAKELSHEYQFQMEPRPEMEGPWTRDAKYCVDARDVGNVARFINHSCEPTLFVQPVCSGHANPDFCTITLVAWRNIPPLTELTYDYGDGYIKEQLSSKCLCGAACCQYK